jgi:hypothetical protein
MPQDAIGKCGYGLELAADDRRKQGKTRHARFAARRSTEISNSDRQCD